MWFFYLEVLIVVIISGKRSTSGSSSNCSSEGTSFNFHGNNSIKSRFAIPEVPKNRQSNKSHNQKPKKTLCRKPNYNSKMRPMLAGLKSNSHKVSLSKNSKSKQVQDNQVRSHSEINLHPTINVINTVNHNISTTNCTNLKGYKSGAGQNPHTFTGAIESSTSLQTALGMPTVHLISGYKEASNGQSTTSSLSLSLPGLSALLAGTLRFYE